MHPEKYGRTRKKTQARIRLPVFAVFASLLFLMSACSTSATQTWDGDFGANVTVFTPDTPVSDIQATLDATHAQQVDDEMGGERFAYLFEPGVYGSDEEPLQIKVGYYTEISGLGASPKDVTINGKIEVYNRCVGEDGGNCIALNNFWRTLSNLTLVVNGKGQEECRQADNFWAVSQAVSVRRVVVEGGTLSLMDYCTAGPQFASGGYIADTKAETILNGSQQQWLTRNSEIGAWTNGVWNQVFSGVEGAPDDANFPGYNDEGVPESPYTTLETTPVSREKPYLFVDEAGSYNVRVPSAQTDTRGVSWSDGMTAGSTVSLDEFFVAKPSDSAQMMNDQLAEGRHLLLTPGVYDIDETIRVTRPDTVILGIGHATLKAVGGAVPLEVGDVSGAVIAGVTIDAGSELSPVLLKVGTKANPGANTAANPTTLSDVYFRVGGPYIGKTETALEVNLDNVLIDHTWVWRGDHGVEGFTEGVNGDTERWNTNLGRNGAIINGDKVTATGLFVEHFQEHNTIWNGEGGTVVLYQNELPYDPPSQAEWTKPDGTLGWAGFKLADDVETHNLYGGGVYVFNQNDPSIVTETGFEVPVGPDIELFHIMTVNLTAGTVLDVVNDCGAQVDSGAPGVPAYVFEYPPCVLPNSD